MAHALLERLLIAVAKAAPDHAISRVVHRLARLESPRLQPLLRRYVNHFGVDLSEAEPPTLESYASFNALFTRALRADARPLAESPDAIVSPADGRVAACGRIDAQGRPVQATDRKHFRAKGHDYSLAALLADADAAARYHGGAFVTLYLSPRDYHRLHMPLDGRLVRTTLVPGRLLSVAPRIVAAIPGLYARNERLICHFDGAHGPFAMALIGAINVGSIETVWGGEATPPRARALLHDDFEPRIAPTLARGAEFARFNLGSSVILLLPAGTAQLRPLTENTAVRVRAEIGRWPAASG